jgi:hypothetical protein
MIERLYGKTKTGAFFSRLEIIEAQFPPEKEQVEDSVQFAHTAFVRHETGGSSDELVHEVSMTKGFYMRKTSLT